MSLDNWFLFNEAVTYLGTTTGGLIQAIQEGKICPLINYLEECEEDGRWVSLFLLPALNAKSEIKKPFGNSDILLDLKVRIPILDDEKLNPIFIERRRLSELIFYQVELDTLKDRSASKSFEVATLKAVSKNMLKKMGDIWEITFNGQAASPMKHYKGLTYLAQLVRHPNTSFSPETLYQFERPAASAEQLDEEFDDTGMSIVSHEAPIEMIDKKTLTAVKNQMEELRLRIADSTSLEEKESLNDQLEKYDKYLKQGSGPRGIKKDPSGRRSYHRVHKAIKESIQKIPSEEIQSHLLSSIRFGDQFIYSSNIVWHVET